MRECAGKNNRCSTFQSFASLATANLFKPSSSQRAHSLRLPLSFFYFTLLSLSLLPLKCLVLSRSPLSFYLLSPPLPQLLIPASLLTFSGTSLLSILAVRTMMLVHRIHGLKVSCWFFSLAISTTPQLALSGTPTDITAQGRPYAQFSASALLLH